MQLLKAGQMFLGFILCVSGALGAERGICVLKGSSVNLTCFAENPAAPNTWCYLKENKTMCVVKEISEISASVTYNITEDGTLTIRDVKKSDEHSFCCQESCRECKNRTKLHVADLQVKVFPASEGQKVTLMCSSSCSLTESPAAFIWYQNGEFLYEDWSPWYQELVSSDQAVRYSCAVKGFEDLRAPDVSVDFIHPDCFSVTYLNGEMCPEKLKSAEAPCSITYPRDVRVEMLPKTDYVTLICKTSCPSADAHTAFTWYWNRKAFRDCTSQDIMLFESEDYVSCAVKNNEYMHSDEICTNSATVNYVSRSLCVLEGAAVNISSKYTKSHSSHPTLLSWYKLKRDMNEEIDVTIMEAGGRLEHHNIDHYEHTLTINNLMKNDSGEYMFTLNKYLISEQPDLLGAILVVTGLKVTMTPSDMVTKGQRVTLTCSTSCPLSEETTYMWFFNEEPLSLTGGHNKQVVLNPVRRHHAGNYSCAVIRSPQNISSTVKLLTVRDGDKTATAAMNITKIVFLLLLPLVGCKLYLMLRKRKTATRRVKASENVATEEVTSQYESLPLTDRNARAAGGLEDRQQDIV
ncbi:B-cell receptor CD22-like [Poeciliopsis prolifica]|uniref:B-cell receptor CD22-like n=1 Tax=Poeciliopsis prolifica TaxID=188132 RepID=UPI002413050F|nr:B-cell receptor CD22-like [Poeciliopsis prolifica]